VPDAFFAPEGDLFAPSELTRGPWDPAAQHAGPPAALIGRAIERCGDPDGRQVGRVTFEILRPVPIEPLSVAARVVRPGRSVELIEAELSSGGEVLVRATAWRLRIQPVELDPPPPAEPPPPGPDTAAERDFFPTGMDVGYHTAMQYRFVEGGFLEAGPATVWMRMRHPLVAGEEPSPLQRVLVAADSGNGVSAALDWRRFLFINTDLSVHLHRLPAGEWVCLDARTFPEAHGVGLADTALYDEEGRIGRAAQTLLVRER
jgi:Thioesterase-like superfamily